MIIVMAAHQNIPMETRVKVELMEQMDLGKMVLAIQRIQMAQMEMEKEMEMILIKVIHLVNQMVMVTIMKMEDRVVLEVQEDLVTVRELVVTTETESILVKILTQVRK